VLSDRKELIAALTRIADEPVTDGEYWAVGHRRHAAMELLGKLRAVEAVPTLVAWLGPRQGQKVSLDLTSYVIFIPAVSALIRIGEPATKHLLNAIAEGFPSSVNKKLAEQEVWRALVGVKKGHLGAFSVLQRAIEEENERPRKDNLRATLNRRAKEAEIELRRECSGCIDRMRVLIATAEAAEDAAAGERGHP